MMIRELDRLELLLAEGESERLEFRPFPIDPDQEQSLAKSIVAFANSRGGTILLGVESSGRVTGVYGDNIEFKLRSIVAERAFPVPTVFIRKCLVRGRPVYMLLVPPSPLRPHRLASNLVEYRRVGTSAQPADEPKLRLVKSDPKPD